MNRQRARERAKEQVVRSASKPMSLNKRSSSPSTKSTQKALESALNLSLVPTDQNWALDMRGEKSGKSMSNTPMHCFGVSQYSYDAVLHLLSD